MNLDEYDEVIYLCYVPPGEWSSGPTVLHGYQNADLKWYKEKKWTIKGPYFLGCACKESFKNEENTR